MEEKILFIISFLDRGGAENSFFKLVNTIKQPFVVITLKKGGYYTRLLLKKKIEVLEIDNSSIPNLINSIIYLLQKISTYKIKLIHCWMYKSCIIGFILSMIFRIRKVIWSIRHSDTTNEDGRDFLKYIMIRICAIISKFNHIYIIYNSNNSKIEHNKIGFKKLKSKIIFNGYDHIKYNTKTASTKIIRQKFCIEKDKFIISMYARFHPLKDHIFLFKALSLLFKEYNNFHLFLAGYKITKENKTLVRLISKFNLNKNTTISGFLDEEELIEAYNITDLTILTSKSESFPNVIPESMLCGTPCLSTNVGDCKEIIQDYGWIINTRNPVELKNKILKIIDEKNSSINKWYERKLINRQSIIERYNLRDSCSKYNELY